MHGIMPMQTARNRKSNKPQKGARSTTEKKMRATLRAAEENALVTTRARVRGDVNDVGTPYTIVKMRPTPVETLIDKHKIGSEERQAADEISLAFFALSSRLMLRGINYDRVDGGRQSNLPWSVRLAGAVSRYQAWANIWSGRNKQYADPTLEIVIAAVIDERRIRGIAQDLCFRPAKIERAIICGLRDYAARADIAGGKHAQRWKDEAQREFAITPDAIRLTAYARARLET